MRPWGNAEYRRLAKRFSNTESIPEGVWIATSASDLPAYFLWVNISTDEASVSSSHSKDVTYRTVEDADGNSTQVVDRVDYVTTSSGTRFVAAEFSIYEAASRQRM